MKLNVSILFIAVQLSMLVATAVSDTGAECGLLGVMSTSDLPEGINVSDVRKCADHPLGHKRVGVQSLAPKSAADLFYERSQRFGENKAKCYFEAPFGCSKGYCWTSCGPAGSGQWCWVSAHDGYGDWVRCTSYTACTALLPPSYNCGKNCKKGSNACGCGCA